MRFKMGNDSSNEAVVWKEDLTHGYSPHGQFGGASALSELSLSLATESWIQLAVPMEKWQYDEASQSNNCNLEVVPISHGYEECGKTTSVKNCKNQLLPQTVVLQSVAVFITAVESDFGCSSSILQVGDFEKNCKNQLIPQTVVLQSVAVFITAVESDFGCSSSILQVGDFEVVVDVAMQLVTKIFTLNNDGWLAADNFKDNAQFTMANLQENNELYCLQNPNKHPILPMKDMKHTDQALDDSECNIKEKAPNIFVSRSEEKKVPDKLQTPVKYEPSDIKKKEWKYACISADMCIPAKGRGSYFSESIFWSFKRKFSTTLIISTYIKLCVILLLTSGAAGNCSVCLESDKSIVVVGESVFFTCRGNETSSVSWIINGTRITDSSLNGVTTSFIDSASNLQDIGILNFHMASLEYNNVTIQCEATLNSGSTVLSNVIPMVVYQVYLNSEKKVYSVGETAYLFCRGYFSYVLWTANGTLVNRSDPVLQGEKLELTDISLEWNNTQLRCETSTPAGVRITSNPLTLIVQGCIPLNLANGMLDYSNSLRVSSIANYTCNETDGYVLTPPGSQATRTCSLNGWTGIDADCELFDCNIAGLQKPNNGKFILDTGNTTFGSAATFKCNDEYQLNGVSRRICGLNGWSEQNPRCILDTASTDDGSTGRVSYGNIALIAMLCLLMW